MEPPTIQVIVRANVKRCWQNGDNWMIQFENSWESICIGPIDPDDDPRGPFPAGTECEILIRKRNALPR